MVSILPLVIVGFPFLHEKGKVYKMVVRPAMLYGLETVPLTKKQEVELVVAELKMLIFSLGVIRMDMQCAKQPRPQLFDLALILHSNALPDCNCKCLEIKLRAF